jgi:hypothetical protein
MERSVDRGWSSRNLWRHTAAIGLVLSGYAEEELRRMTFLDVTHADDRHFVEQVAAVLLARRRALEMTLFRVVHETLINVHHHADSRSAALRIPERLQQLSGRLEIESSSTGTTVRAIVPLRAPSR